VRQDSLKTNQVSTNRSLLGALVRGHRLQSGLTQEQLAERAGLSERTIRNLEGGQVRRPYPATFESLAEALELSSEQRAALVAAARAATPGLYPVRTTPCLLPPSVADFTGRGADRPTGPGVGRPDHRADEPA
jgi:transcriptional regulator with XRE-family HTH domain